MKVDDAEEALVLVLECYPIAQRPKIVTEMYVAGGLGAAKDSLGHAFLNFTKPDDIEAKVPDFLKTAGSSRGSSRVS